MSNSPNPMLISPKAKDDAPIEQHLKTFEKGVASRSNVLPWIEVAKNAPYFITEKGESWTPIGQNDAITWPELKGLFLRKDTTAANAYFRLLAQNGVTCLRLMLEYCQGENRYFEKPVGRFQPNMLQLWDDLFSLCELHGLRILLTPFDTFWMHRRWIHHPYNAANGGPCARRNRLLLCAGTRQALKARLLFATQRWGGSGALFGWDIWNEINPAHGGNSVAVFWEFVEDISSFLRAAEIKLHGRAHLQTVSVFGPVLQKHPAAAECVFRHPGLDFASVHFYGTKSIDHPKNTVDAAISTGVLTRDALDHTNASRPFLDTEHGPIHLFKDRGKTLAEPFDDEYFRHMQWAHFASGGAGGGMRWPNRHPHSLTPGMRSAQKALASFLSQIDWQQFRRKNLNKEVSVSQKAVAVFACGSTEQAIVWLLRTNSRLKNGMLDRNARLLPTFAGVPHLRKGQYRLVVWDTLSGTAVAQLETRYTGGNYLFLPEWPLVTDIAFALTRASD